MLLTASSIFLALFTICSSQDHEELSGCGGPLPYVKQDDLPEFDPSKYLAASNDTKKPFNIHFVISSNVSEEMREAIGNASEFVNKQLSRMVMAPPLSEIRRERTFVASLQRCLPPKCNGFDVPGEYAMPCSTRTPVLDVRLIVEEEGIPPKATEHVSQLNAQNSVSLVVYVFANNTSPYQVVQCQQKSLMRAFAVYCQLDPESNRPTHGAIGICDDAAAFRGEKAMRIFLHETLHILLFGSMVGKGSSQLGCPGEDERDCEGVTYQKERQNLELPDNACETRTKILTITPTVKMSAKQHYSFDGAEGAEIETYPTDGVERCSASGRSRVYPNKHWSPHPFPDEILMPWYDGGARISSFTLGLLNDLGWYDVDMDKAEAMPVIKPEQDGDLVYQKSCYEVIRHWRKKQMNERQRQQDFTVITQNMGPYCDLEFTAPDRVVTPLCYKDTEPLECRDIGKGCGLVMRPPYYDSFLCDSKIIEDKYHPEIGATVGDRSMCLSISMIYMKRFGKFKSFGVCVQYYCKKGSVELILHPHNNGTCEIACPRGQSNKMFIADFTDNEFCRSSLSAKFVVTCPDYDSLCPSGGAPFDPPTAPSIPESDGMVLGDIGPQSKAPKMNSGDIVFVLLGVAVVTASTCG